MTLETPPVLRVTHRFTASAERVFDAWVNPNTAAKWLFTTPTSESHETQIDARVGGRWTIVDRRAGTDYKAIGEYLEVDRPRRLAFTFGMPQFSASFMGHSGAGGLSSARRTRQPVYSIDDIKGVNDYYSEHEAQHTL
jgi:uncharacterized protein YndB with AHSA1/START domain